MLALDDPRWHELSQRNQPGGADPDAPFVPDILARLYAAPEDTKLFSALWPYLCSEGTTWEGAYAAAPHFLMLARTVDRASDARAEYLIVVGLIVIDEIPESGKGFPVPDYLRSDYDDAKRQAVPLLLQTLENPWDEQTTRYLLAALSALRGYPRLGRRVSWLELDNPAD